MKRRISLTFLWTDESVMLEDFQRKVSKEMLEWAREFYKTYDLELAVKPEPNVGTVALAQKFALVKNDGIQPDLDLITDILEKHKKRMDKIEQELRVLSLEIDRLIALLGPPAPSNSAPLLGELKQAVNRLKQLPAEIEKARGEKDAEIFRLDYDAPLRLQMTDKFMFDKIGGHDSIYVVFARFKYRTAIMSPRHPGFAPGITKMRADVNPLVFDPGGIPRWVWPYPYILLDIQRSRPKNLAHEIVHPFGPEHPDTTRIIKNLEKILGYRHPRTLLDLAVDRAMGVPSYESLFKEVPGGYFDGAENDIMNYSTDEPNPSDYVLREEHRQKIFDSKEPFITDIP